MLKSIYTQGFVLLLFTILINISGWQLDAAAQNVSVPDANLAAGIRTALGLGATDPIPETALAGLQSL